VDQAAGLLAMHCMVRGQSPSDYVVMVRAENDLLEGLTEKAEKLLQAGHSVGSPVKLTRREEEVLAGVMKSLAKQGNCRDAKSFRTHGEVSCFVAAGQVHVRGRMELVREASRNTMGPMTMPTPMPIASREARTYAASAAEL